MCFDQNMAIRIKIFYSGDNYTRIAVIPYLNHSHCDCASAFFHIECGKNTVSESPKYSWLFSTHDSLWFTYSPEMGDSQTHFCGTLVTVGNSQLIDFQTKIAGN